MSLAYPKKAPGQLADNGRFMASSLATANLCCHLYVTSQTKRNDYHRTRRPSWSSICEIISYKASLKSDSFNNHCWKIKKKSNDKYQSDLILSLLWMSCESMYQYFEVIFASTVTYFQKTILTLSNLAQISDE